MDLKNILTVSGKGGLFKMVSQGKDHVIVESLNDKSKMPIFSSTKISSLGDICVYTEEEDLPLKDVFKEIHKAENGGKAIDSKADNKAIKTYMEKVLPHYDKDRVYVSDMKKLFSWYNSLLEHELLSFEEAEEQEQKDLPEKA